MFRNRTCGNKWHTFFHGWMPFLSHDQQCQSAEENIKQWLNQQPGLLILCSSIHHRTSEKQVRQQTCKTHTPPLQPWAMPPPAIPTAQSATASSWCTCRTHRTMQLQSSRNLCRRPREESQSSPKGEKTCLDSRSTSMQNFTPLAFSPAEKSVTVQRNKKKQNDKQNYTQ